MVDPDLTFAEKKLSRLGVNPRREADLIGLLRTDGNDYTVSYAIEMLRDAGVGTANCIPALKAVSRHPKQDVQVTAVYTLQRIAGGSELEFYRRVLASPDHRMKYPAVDAIAAYGDESDVGLMAGRLKALTSGRLKHGGGTETFAIVGFLEEFAGHNAAAREALEKVHARLDRLNPDEQRRIPRLSPTIRPSGDWLLVVLPEIEERARLGNLVFSWIEPMGLLKACPTDRRFRSAVHRWLSIATRVVVFGETTEVEARSTSPVFRGVQGLSILPLPEYVAKRFSTTAAFLDAARADEVGLRAKVKAVSFGLNH